MKTLRNLIIPALLVMIIAACTSIRVTSDYDRKADFRKYRTFNFSKEADRINLNDLNRRRLKDDIVEQMELRGYRTSNNPDLLINVFIKGRTKTTAYATHFGGPFGYYRWGWGPSSSYIDVNRYTEGTLFVDVIDVSEKRMIWEGVAEGLINPRTQTREKELRKVVERIFDDFPR